MAVYPRPVTRCPVSRRSLDTVASDGRRETRMFVAIERSLPAPPLTRRHVVLFPAGCCCVHLQSWHDVVRSCRQLVNDSLIRTSPLSRRRLSAGSRQMPLNDRTAVVLCRGAVYAAVIPRPSVAVVDRVEIATDIVRLFSPSATARVPSL